MADYHELYKSGKITPLTVAKALLPLIKRDVTPQSSHSSSFISTNEALVLQAAEASTLRYQKGESFGILDGIPVAVKDECDVEGYRTTFGRKMNESLFKVQDESDWPVQKWVAAGAIVLGKLNMHELGADTTGNNPNWGTPKNPHNEMYYPGGSSSGAASAVSAGLIPFALGGDGGGSIRIPSSFCGIYGLKTSHNRVQETGSTVTVKGPMAASISDLEVAYRVMATPNPESPLCSLFSAPRPLSASINSNRPKVLGIYPAWFNRADEPVLSLCRNIIKHYETNLGYTVVDIEIPYLVQGQKAHAFTILDEMANRTRARSASPATWLQALNPANKILLSVAETTPASDYLLAQQMRNLLMQHLAYLYQKHPGLIIVHPTTPMPGWPIGNYPGDLSYGVSDGNRSIRNMEYVWLANFTGCPAINCPVGYVDPVKGKGKIPVGITGMGNWGSEDVLIEWGREAEMYLNNEAQGGGRQRPSNWEDVLNLAVKVQEHGESQD